MEELKLERTAASSAFGNASHCDVNGGCHFETGFGVCSGLTEKQTGAMIHQWNNCTAGEAGGLFREPSRKEWLHQLRQ